MFQFRTLFMEFLAQDIFMRRSTGFFLFLVFFFYESDRQTNRLSMAGNSGNGHV